MAAPFSAIRSALQAHDVELREFVTAPGHNQLKVLFERDAASPEGIEAFRRALVVEHADGKWTVAPPSGDCSFTVQSYNSEAAAVEATLVALRRDA